MSIYVIDHPVGDQNITIQVEMDESLPLGRPDARGMSEVTEKVLTATRDVFGDALQLAHNCAVGMVQSLKQMSQEVRPNEFEVKFCVKLSSEVGAVITKMGGEAQLEISMKWVHKEDM